MAKKNKALPIIIIAGAGVAGYFLYKYFKEKEEEPEHPKKGFNISKYSWEPESPSVGEEVSVTVIGKNITEQADCYCKIINLDTQQQVFYILQ